MALTCVAVVVPNKTAMFELGVVTEIFGMDRTDDGVPLIDFRACSEQPGVPLEMRNGLSITINTEGAIVDAYVITDKPGEVAEWIRGQGWAR